MTIDDINSHRTIGCSDAYNNGIFNISCTLAMSYVLQGHNNIKSFGTKYTVVPTNGENLCAPRWFIECDGNVGIAIQGYATGDRCLATVMRDGEVCIGIAYQFTNIITPGTATNDLSEELYRLILALLHYGTIDELKNMRGPDNYIPVELTEQVLKNIITIPDDNPECESAEVIELR